jgi:hypothetical protein
MPAGDRWNRQPPDMEGSCYYIKHTVTDSTQGMVIQHGGWVRGPQPLPVTTTSYKTEHKVLDAERGFFCKVRYAKKN